MDDAGTFDLDRFQEWLGADAWDALPSSHNHMIYRYWSEGRAAIAGMPRLPGRDRVLALVAAFRLQQGRTRRSAALRARDWDSWFSSN